LNKKFQFFLVLAVGISVILILIGNSNLPSQISDKNPTQIYSKSSLVSKILQECERDEECVYLKLQQISKTETEETVIFVANQIPMEWEKEEQTCHQIAHHVSEFLLGYFDGNLTKAISHVSNVCGNALYHGVVENYLTLQVLLEDIEIDDLDIVSPCMNIGTTLESNLHQQCVHGLGHSLATVYDFNVIEAIKRCDEFQNNIDKDRCADGLFMENNNENIKTGSGTFDDIDIFYPCNKLEELYKFRCYFYNGYYILRINDYSYEQSFKICEKIPDEKFIPRCIGAISTDMTFQRFYNNHEKIIMMCDSVNPKYQWDCILNSLNTLTLYFDTNMGEDLCNLVTKNLEEKCLRSWKDLLERHASV
jgi:hypothetical protein